MTEPRRSALITTLFGFGGLLLFLTDVRSTGEALQTLRLKIELTEISEARMTHILIPMGVATWLPVATKRGRAGA